MDDCKLAVALSFGTRVGSFSCAAAQRVNPKVESDNYRYMRMSRKDKYVHTCKVVLCTFTLTKGYTS